MILFFFQTTTIYSKINIRYKIDDQIITNQDITNEQKYLLFLRPNLDKISEKELIKISENSIIREIIKKKEINKVFKNFDELNLINKLKKNLFKFKDVKNDKEFKELLIKSNLDYKIIIDKIKYEALWNELIFIRFNQSIKIDKKLLKQRLISRVSNNKKFEYNLSELLFELKKDEKLKTLNLKILDSIKKDGFKSTASKYSIAESSVRGGEIGWIKETLLSENLNKILSKTEIGNITKPIKIPNGYLILKDNNKKQIKQKINLENELKEMENYERNKQLNQFSLLYFKKLKQNTNINEY